MSDVNGIGLAEVLAQLRYDLAEAQEQGTTERLQFEVTEAEVELEVALTKERGPEGKVKIDVVAIGGFEFGGKSTTTGVNTHRVTLRLAVIDRDTGRPANVSSGKSRDRVR